MAIVEAKVKPKRLTDNRESYRRYWWQYAEKRVEMSEALRGLDRVIVIPFVSKHLAPCFVPAGTVVAGPANVIALEGYGAFGLLQSRPHATWAQFLTSSLEDRPRYLPSDCFETFPFPNGWHDREPLESAGRRYHDFRAALMVRRDEGLTRTYNRFHDPDDRDSDIQKLRDLHAAMDRAVLDAYGWTDIQPTCEFILDYEDDDDDETAGRPNRRRKPWRYRWPDEIRDEVLGRLLALNAQRASAEAHGGKRTGPAAARQSRKPARGSAAPLLD
jgi:hypothetical protein